MKLQQNNKTNQFFLNLPLSVVRAKQWKKGDKLNILISKEGDILIKKAG